MKPDGPVLIALGANLPSRLGGPRETLAAALDDLAARGVRTVARSRWYRTPPWPPSDQPWYVNAVACVATDLDPAALLAVLHAVEHDLGRARTVPNAARPVDLDLIAHGTHVMEGNITVPHPRLQERAFVLLPLRDVAPGWVDPRSGRPVDDLVAALPADDVAACEVIEQA
ncbi:2-amino-4-hydroxy-6-hydroxymethyldihydropteridine diphosphokinase [Caenispirillum salinarum]|uniref:2-amino-4-hydroxy-6- hydroxymethyldihydropteridine diphosphokinase n=1 Tax=Caenispirillum salinarum TaxID=859058 RepID=UPI003851368C